VTSVDIQGAAVGKTLSITKKIDFRRDPRQAMCETRSVVITSELSYYN